MQRIFLTSKSIYMAVVAVLIMAMLCASATASSIEPHHDRDLVLDKQKETMATEESSFGRRPENLMSGFLSGVLPKKKPSIPNGALPLLEKLLSASGGRGRKLVKLFKILNTIAGNDKNGSSSSSNNTKLLLQFFKSEGSASLSNNRQLAMRLISLAQGKKGLSSLNANDLKLLRTFVSG